MKRFAALYAELDASTSTQAKLAALGLDVGSLSQVLQAQSWVAPSCMPSLTELVEITEMTSLLALLRHIGRLRFSGQKNANSLAAENNGR